MGRSLCRAIICIISIFSCVSAYASDIPTIHSIPGYGNWNDPLSWSEGRTPTSDDVVEINSTMTLDASPTIAGIIVNSGSSLSGPYNSLTVSGDMENHGSWTIGTLILGGDVVIHGSLIVSGDINLNNHFITLDSGTSLTVNGQISGSGTFYGDNISLNTYGDIFNTSITGSGLYMNIFGTTTMIDESHFTTKEFIVHSGSTITNRYHPYYGFFDLRLYATVDTLRVESGAVMNINRLFTLNGNIINNGTISGADAIINGDIENYGNWNLGNIQISGSGTMNISGSHLINSHFTLNTDIYLPVSIIFGKDTNFNNHSITIGSGRVLTINGQMSGTGNFIGDNISLNTYGNIFNANITGSGLQLNIYGTTTMIDESHFTAREFIVHSGSTITNRYDSNLGFFDLRLYLTVDTLHIQSGASMIINRLLDVHGNIINKGNISGLDAVINGNIINNGIWNFNNTYASWSPAAGATSYAIQFDPGSSTGFTTSATSYNISDKIAGSYYWQVTPDNSGPYDRRCINIVGCITGGAPIQTGSTLSFISSIPTASATGVAIDSSITLNFSKSLDQSTVPGNIILRKTDGDVVDTTALSYSGNSIVFHSTSPLDNNTSYTVELNTGLKDIDGNTLGSATYFSFTTATAIPKPTGLSQQIQSPGLDILQPIGLGEKIGKYQSGSGVILSGTVNTSEPSKLVVDVYRVGDTTPREFSSGYSMDSVKEVTLPYLGTGSYRWKARIEAITGAVSDWVDFGTDNPEEIDYTLYEGFEPYPYGYRFVNSIPDSTMLTGGIKYERNFLGQVIGRTKVSGTKWDIMDKIFPESSLKGGESEYFDAFEILGLQNERPQIFSYGSCFGLSLSALTRYYYPELLQKNFPEFSKNIGTGFIWDNINVGFDQNNKKWIGIDDNIKTILAYHLYQREDSYTKKAIESGSNDTPVSILNKIKNNPGKHLLTITGRNCYIFGSICSDKEAHVVVPYKTEGNKIYIWDNNYPYTKSINDTYNRYIEIDTQNNTFTTSGYWNTLTDMSVVSLDDAYSGSTSPIGFSKTDTVYSLSGSSDLQIIDAQGRISGFSGGTIMEGIPGVQVIVPLNATVAGSPDNTWKQIYLSQKLPGLTIKVSGKTTEPYDLMIAGGDYYTKVSGVTTSTGQLDNYQVTGTGLTIDFDNQKTGNYSLLTDNFQDSLTGTVLLSDILSTPSPQKFSYDWNKVIQKTTDAILYQVDSNSDGIYDISSNFSPVPTSSQATGSISGYIQGNTNATMAGWKVVLTKQQDDNKSCKENKKKGDREDSKYKNKEERKCSDEDYNREIFAITDKKGYYRFTNLSPGTYSVSIESQKNWSVIKPQNNIYNISLISGQNIINLNFETNFLKGKNK